MPFGNHEDVVVSERRVLEFLKISIIVLVVCRFKILHIGFPRLSGGFELHKIVCQGQSHGLERDLAQIKSNESSYLLT